MRPKLFSAMTLAVLGSATAVAADSTAPVPNTSRIESVLLQVDTQGKITEASPAYVLSPALTRLLDTNLRAMIRSPATDTNGKPVPSEFVMDVSLQNTPDGKGGYEVHFAYVSSRRLPPGAWYWTHVPGDRVVLSNRNASSSPMNRPMGPSEQPPPNAYAGPSAPPPSSTHTH